MYPFYLGIDLHLKRTYVVLMDVKGEVIDERRLPNAEMRGYLEEHVPQETYAVLEATRNWPFMYDMLSDHVERVELAHPKEVKAIANAEPPGYRFSKPQPALVLGLYKKE